MAWLRGAAGELLGLFVDDVRLAAAILGWIALAWAATHLLGLDAPWLAPPFALGLVAILLASAIHRARQR